VIVGAGPAGLYLGVALARRGQQVSVVDRDKGPNGSAWWERKGVMQFHHPHAFRLQVLAALQAEMPEVVDGLMAAGAVPIPSPDGPAGCSGCGAGGRRSNGCCARPPRASPG